MRLVDVPLEICDEDTSQDWRTTRALVGGWRWGSRKRLTVVDRGLDLVLGLECSQVGVVGVLVGFWQLIRGAGNQAGHVERISGLVSRRAGELSPSAAR